MDPIGKSFSRRERRTPGDRGRRENRQRPWAGPGQLHHGPPCRCFLCACKARTQVLTINVKTNTRGFLKRRRIQGGPALWRAARRHLSGKMEDDFFIGTKEELHGLVAQASARRFFGVFILVSAISVVIGGIVIMNVMLVSVNLRRRRDWACVARSARRSATSCGSSWWKPSCNVSPAEPWASPWASWWRWALSDVYAISQRRCKTWVAVMGVFLSSGVGLFFRDLSGGACVATRPDCGV